MTQFTKQNTTLFAALRRNLRPLVKFLLASGITYPQISELLKSLFIEVAENDFRLPNKQQTDSRINFLTGIHRKDVKRLRNETMAQHSAPETASLGALLVSRWIADSAYVDSNGKPIPLARQKAQGGEQSFEALVASVNKDIRSRAILDEWLNLGVVYLDEHNRIHLNIEAFIPEQGYDEKAHFFAENLHDHIAAATHNMLGKQPGYMERAVFYDHLTQDSVDKIAESAEKNGMQLLKSINQQSLELQNNDKKETQNNRRYRLGIYFFSDTEEPSINTKK